MAVNVLEKLVDYYHENKISHVYLVETNNIDACLNDLKKVCKQIFCTNTYKDECNSCNICNLVDQNYLPSLIIISPDGSSIKKEQILELKHKFSTVPVYTKENIYIIQNAELMTASSANTMLKFLEEPEANIIGFFITSNLNNVIPTIRSRCEVIKAMYATDSLSVTTLFNDENKPYLDIAYKYITKLEVEKKDLIMYNRSVLLSELTEREDIKKIFQIMLIIYSEYFKNTLNLANQSEMFNEVGYLSNLSSKNILAKISLLTRFLEDITCNVNLELLLDKFVIELSDIDE